MRVFFVILSIAYISGIFLLADSPVISSLSPFNPYSLLHIPIYGVLAILLILSLNPPDKPDKLNKLDKLDRQKDQKDQINQTDQIDENNHLLSVFLISIGVALADEVYQSFIPNRDASIIDIFLDILGVGIALFFSKNFLCKNRLNRLNRLNRY